ERQAELSLVRADIHTLSSAQAELWRRVGERVDAGEAVDAQLAERADALRADLDAARADLGDLTERMTAELAATAALAAESSARSSAIHDEVERAQRQHDAQLAQFRTDVTIAATNQGAAIARLGDRLDETEASAAGL